MSEKLIDAPKVDETKEVKTEGDFKLKKSKLKTKNLGKTPPKVVKIDLKQTEKKEENAISVEKTGDLVENKQTGDMAKVEKPIQESKPDVEDKKEEIEESPLELVTDEKDDTESSGVDGSTKVADTPKEQKEVLPETKTQELPENVDKLISFMKETGGTIEDYARLNADYSNVNDTALLKEYYKTSKPHLTDEEIQFVIEDSFTFDEELEEKRDVRKKQLAFKDEVAKAKNYLDGLKDKYYAEIKLRPGTTQEQQKALDFFNRYNEDQQANEEKHKRFIDKTKNYFNDDFKGFDFQVGDKKFRYNVKNPSNVADNQSDISNFIGKYLNKNGEIENAPGYHKALYAAQNADTIANHFYEQGRTDAIKNQMIKSKNITTEARATQSGEVFIDGFKVKAVSGVDSSRLKIKTKKFN